MRVYAKIGLNQWKEVITDRVRFDIKEDDHFEITERHGGIHIYYHGEESAISIEPEVSNCIVVRAAGEMNSTPRKKVRG